MGRAAALALLLLLAGMPIRHAGAQYFSPDDGIAPGGRWRVQLEIDPYLWLPAVSASAHLGRVVGSDVSVNSGLPSIAELANHLHFSFMGYAQVRWGILSADLDTQYITASGSRTTQLPASGRAVGLGVSTTLFRIAPGIGLQLAKGTLFGIPVELDERAGFAYFDSSTELRSDRDLLGGRTSNISFVQPWFGLRIYAYPSPRWRVELGAVAQGFGVDGGSWGWGANAIVSYAVNEWLNVNGGFRALSTKRYGSDRRTDRSIDLTAYGPVLGVGFRF